VTKAERLAELLEDLAALGREVGELGERAERLAQEIRGRNEAEDPLGLGDAATSRPGDPLWGLA